MGLARPADRLCGHRRDRKDRRRRPEPDVGADVRDGIGRQETLSHGGDHREDARRRERSRSEPPELRAARHLKAERRYLG